jgi:hypothetical protein
MDDLYAIEACAYFACPLVALPRFADRSEIGSEVSTASSAVGQPWFAITGIDDV